MEILLATPTFFLKNHAHYLQTKRHSMHLKYEGVLATYNYIIL